MQCKEILLLLGLVAALRGTSQNICRISNDEGLSNSSIISLAQDVNGYIWAGSCEGLNLWDGSYVRNYRLSGNLIQDIIATDDGYLWVRTNYGIDRLDTRNKSVEEHTEFSRIYQFTARSRDEAFFIRQGALYGYYPHESGFVEMATKIPDLTDVAYIWLDKRDFLWFVSHNKIAYATVSVNNDGLPQLGALQYIQMQNGIDFAYYDGVKSIYFTDATGVLFHFDMEQRRAFYIYDLGREVRERGEISAVVKDKDDYVIAFEMNGVLRLHSTAHIEGEYVLRKIDVNSGVFSLLKDRNQDIIWMGTDGSGLLRQSDGDVAVRSVSYDVLPYKLSKPIKALFLDHGGALWVGTKNDGILCIDDFYRCKSFTRENTRSFTMNNSSLRRNSVYTFAPSRRNVLWMAGDGGVSYYSYRDRRIHLLPGSEELRSVHNLLESDDSTLWAATVGHGVFRIDLAGGRDEPRAVQIETVDLGQEAQRGNFFFSIFKESDSILWFSNHGLGAVRYRIHEKQGEVLRFDTRRGLAVNDVTCSARSSDGTMWFATGCGLDRCHATQGESVPEYNHDVLRNGVIHGLIADSLDNIWVSTNSGIVRYTPQTNRSVVYGSTYGLEVMEFSDGAYFYDRPAGTLFFGGINGFVVINSSDNPAVETYMPPIQFREVTANGTTYGIAELMQNGVLELGHSQSAFTLSLVALDYINGSNYSYLCNIEGLNDRWNDNRHNDQLVFANLQAGRYILNVRYRNNMTGELSPVCQLAIRIRPPLYASTGAWVLYIILSLLITSLTAWYLVRRRRERTRRQQALYEQRQREILYESRIWSFANLTDELSIPLTLINGPCQQIIEYKSTDGFIHRQAEFIQRNAEKLNDLIYMLNEFKSAGPADKVDDIELLDITKLTGSIAQTFIEYAETNSIVYRMEIDSGIIFSVTRNGFTMMLNILLYNAFRRTSAQGEVSFRVMGGEEQLRIEITNRGEGLDRKRIEMIFDRYRMFDYLENLNRKGVSLKENMELAICHNLVLKLQGDFRVEDDGDMTTFVMVLPRLEITKAVYSGVQPEIVLQPRFNPPTPAKRSVAAHSASLPTMLVVNEERDMTAFIADLFVDEYNIGEITDLGNIADALRESHPQIIVCATMSLNGDMIGVIHQIRQTKHLSQIPIILLTATPRSDIKIEGLELGVDICLTLPFNITHLRSVAAQLRRRYESLKDYGRSVFNSFDLTQGKMLHKDDKAFLDRMLDLIQRNLLDAELSTQFIADKMSMSLCNFYRKLGTITEQTPAGIIKEYRLCLAEQLLLTTKLSIDEIIYKSGFANRSTFFRSFIARFGCTPKIYREQKIREAMEQN